METTSCYERGSDGRRRRGDEDIERGEAGAGGAVGAIRDFSGEHSGGNGGRTGGGCDEGRAGRGTDSGVRGGGKLMQKIKYSGKRVETGAVKFGDDWLGPHYDWAGLFIRGDDALYLSQLIGKMPLKEINEIEQEFLMGLVNIIEKEVAERE